MYKPEQTINGYFSFLSYLGIGFAMCTITGFATHPGITETKSMEHEHEQHVQLNINTVNRFNYLLQ